MRINGFGTGSVEDRERLKNEPSATGSSSSQAPAAGAAAKPATGEQSVVISPAAQQLSAAVSRADAARSQRVASVRAKVQSGTYPIDKSKLAERIVDDELERAGRR